WHNVAVGFSFASTSPQSARLEIRVPAASRKSFSAARRIQLTLGAENARIKFYRRPMLNAGKYTAAINLKKDPIHVGASVGSAYATGTLGGFCTDGEGKVHFLSCSHVLHGFPSRTKHGNATKGDSIFQPGPKDKSPTNANEVGKLANFCVL